MKYADLKILIVDDDVTHNTILKRKLIEIGVEEITQSYTFRDASSLLNANHYDIILLDFYLDEGKTCLDFDPEILESPSFPIIYLSSFYEESTFDQLPKRSNILFLSKNVSIFDLKKGLELVALDYKLKSPSLLIDDFLFIKKAKIIVKVMIVDIMYIEVDGKYLCLHCKLEKHLIRMTLTDFFKKLPSVFIKIHQSIVINLQHMDFMDIEQSSITVNQVVLPMSRSHRKMIMTNRYFT